MGFFGKILQKLGIGEDEDTPAPAPRPAAQTSQRGGSSSTSDVVESVQEASQTSLVRRLASGS